MEIINKVKNSGLITIDLEDFLPNEDMLVGLDLAPQLWQGMVLKEKDFRDYIAKEDWSKYADKIVHVYCSEDAIIPPWAYMLLASALFGHASQVVFGNRNEALETLLFEKVSALDKEQYLNARVVIKGCAKVSNIEKPLTAITQNLRGVAKSIMYGEPCSTVPIYKAPKEPINS